MFGFLKPFEPKKSGDYLVRCSCGRVMWLRAPDKIKRHHMGHQLKVLEYGTFWEFLSAKLGLVNKRNFNEFTKDWYEMGAGK